MEDRFFHALDGKTALLADVVEVFKLPDYDGNFVSALILSSAALLAPLQWFTSLCFENLRYVQALLLHHLYYLQFKARIKRSAFRGHILNAAK